MPSLSFGTISPNCTTQGIIAPFEKVGIKEGEKMPMPGDEMPTDAHAWYASSFQY